MEHRFSNGRASRLVEGEVTRVVVDAVGNAANEALAGGGGVDGAIHRSGGPAIMRGIDQIRARIDRCPAGGAVATTAGRLPAECVLQAVGHVYRDGRSGEAELLASCQRTSLKLADVQLYSAITGQLLKEQSVDIPSRPGQTTAR